MAVKLNCGRGGESLTDEEKDIVLRISEAHSEKISRYIKNINSFDVHLKCHKKKSNVKRYEIAVRITGDGMIFEAETDEWDLKKAAVKAFDKILSEIEHRVRKE
ncbi:MAG: HPF/RaiA family ribosome-associated protein [Nanoarchaeota archaeon]